MCTRAPVPAVLFTTARTHSTLCEILVGTPQARILPVGELSYVLQHAQGLPHVRGYD